MRFLHIADLHIGKRVNGFSMLEDQRGVLSQIVGLAQEHNACALVIAGDIFDKAAPSAESVSVFDTFLSDLAQARIKVIAVPGNHDSAERIAYAHRLLSARDVWFAPVYDGTISHVTLVEKSNAVTQAGKNEVSFWLIPFLKPADVRRYFPRETIGDSYASALRCALSVCEIDPNMRNVAVSHQFVTAGTAATERADEEIKLGGIDNVDVSVYDAFDYVALGHVHRPQRVGREEVRYAGSLLKYSFSEIRYPKSAVLVDLGAKAPGDTPGSCVSYELLPLVAPHDLKELRAPLATILAQAGSHEVRSRDYLHVILCDEHPQLDAMQKLRAIFPNVMALDYDNLAIREARLMARNALDPDKVDTVELFAHFYEEQVGKPMDDEQIDIVRRVNRAVVEAGASRPAAEKGDRQ